MGKDRGQIFRYFEWRSKMDGPLSFSAPAATPAGTIEQVTDTSCKQEKNLPFSLMIFISKFVANNWYK